MTHPTLRLICLPFAGGNQYAYRAFSKHLPAHIEMMQLEPPGRGKRMTEPLLTDMQAMAVDALRQLKTIPSPYAIYGHSMGALLGYLLTREILKKGLPPPMHLFFSGRRAPTLGWSGPSRYNLPKAEFIALLRDLGGCPPEILAEPELLDFFEPILRADFQAVEHYKHPTLAPLNIPITIMLGTEEETQLEQIEPWQKETTRPLRIRKFPGGHFFIYEHKEEILRLIAGSCRAALGG